MTQREATAFDQFMLELINRARLNPQVEADRLIPNGELNEGVPAIYTISTTPKQPLAFNPYINQAAKDHSDWMLNNDIFSHTGVNGTSSKERMENAGYNLIAPWGTGENIAWKGTTGNVNFNQFVIDNYEALFIDENYPNRGHRVTILNDDFQEIGISNIQGLFTTNNITYNSVMTTQDFAYSRQEGAFLTGVIYNDATIDDDFYTVGEGIGGISITATKVDSGEIFTTENATPGGYSLLLPRGTYQVSFIGNLDQDSQDDVVYKTITIADQNVKFDIATDDPILVEPIEPIEPIQPIEPVETPETPDSLLNQPLFRFQNEEQTGTYLYAGEEESQNIRRNYPQFNEEGFAFFVGMTADDDLMPMYRFQNDDVPGTYLYAGEEESQTIRDKYDNFREEGLAFYVYGADNSQGTSIYRFQNLNLPGTYLFVGENERQQILANYPSFVEEGLAFKVEI